MTPHNTPNALVQRDGSGGFVAGNASFTGVNVSGDSRFGNGTYGQLRVDTNGGLVAFGGGIGDVPWSGPGNRMMWYPKKAAFRAGTALSDAWDDANLGMFSVAAGYDTRATNQSAVAMGHQSVASGTYASIALGYGATASGQTAFATGAQTTASGNTSTAMGYQTTAEGSYSTAMGYGSQATREYATAMGYLTVASNAGSTAMGLQSQALGGYSVAAGQSSYARGRASVAMGDQVQANGDASTSLGYFTQAAGPYSVAIGDHTIAAGRNSTAIGRYATATPPGSFVYGDASVNTPVTATNSHQFVVRAVGGTIFYSSPGLLTGVRLMPGGGSWLTVSDVAKKENFRALDGEEVLKKLASMSIFEWNYITQEDDIRHVGPFAQDFYAAFGLGTSDKSMATVDTDGIALVAVQALERRTTELNTEVARLQSENAELLWRLERLEALLNSGREK